MDELLDKGNLFLDEEKERARQILQAVEGMNVCRAQSLLRDCINALSHVTVHYC